MLENRLPEMKVKCIIQELDLQVLNVQILFQEIKTLLKYFQQGQRKEKILQTK